LFTLTVRTCAIAATIGSALVVAACGETASDTSSPSAAADGSKSGTTKIKYGYLPVDNQAAVRLGDRRGIFAKHGITLTFAPVAPTGAAAISQLLSGQIDAAGAAVTSVIAAVSQRVPVRAVSSYTDNYEKGGKTQNALIVRADSGIGSFKDLEGKTVGVNSLKGTWEVGLKEAIARDGGDPSKVKIVAIPFNTHVATLKRGTADAVAAIEPFLSELLAAGYKSLGSTDAAALDDPVGSSGAVYMSKKFIDEHPDVVERWNAALAEASEYANSHPEETRAIIAEETGAPIAAVKRRPLPAYNGQLDRRVIETWGELLVKYDIIDSAPPIEEVVAEGAFPEDQAGS
jgi:NitT/TauT family transport system substrate-binding protein